MLFAFARDGGLPGAEYVARVSPRFRSPHVAVWVSAMAAFVVALWADAYSAIVALTGRAEAYGLIPKNWTVEKCSSAQVKGAEGNEEKSVQ